MPCVYILLSKTSGKFYIGSSRENNPQIRLKAHNLGKTRSTKSGCPWVVIYTEEYLEPLTKCPD
jgi:putative endonuclease